jgi:hypothetical protein
MKSLSLGRNGRKRHTWGVRWVRIPSQGAICLGVNSGDDRQARAAMNTPKRGSCPPDFRSLASKSGGTFSGCEGHTEETLL